MNLYLVKSFFFFCFTGIELMFSRGIVDNAFLKIRSKYFLFFLVKHKPNTFFAKNCLNIYFILKIALRKALRQILYIYIYIYTVYTHLNTNIYVRTYGKNCWKIFFTKHLFSILHNKFNGKCENGMFIFVLCSCG